MAPRAERLTEAVTLYEGDCLESLRSMPDESVNCCVTSPPYFGLRDYGTGTWEGGNPACDHLMPPLGGTGKSTLKNDGRPADKVGHGRTNLATRVVQYPNLCGKCGATRIDQQIGLEETPAAYIARLVAVFAEVRRVLTKDGTCWVNLGDSYANKGCDSQSVGGFTGARVRAGKKGIMDSRPRDIPDGCKPKDLIGIPWMFAFAAREDGWYLRQDIIWAKPNPMPESVTDRCVKAHEYLFLLTKSARYWWDHEANQEPASGRAPGNIGHKYQDGAIYGDKRHTTAQSGLTKIGARDTRTRRSVWTVKPEPYPEAHFATYPPALIEPCIRVSCPVGGVVLDPFAGSGTTLEVAVRAKRQAVGIELNPGYCRLIRDRIDVLYQRQPGTLFATISEADA